MKKYNFGAGPSILPPEVIKATADALINFDGTGLSLAEISHRTKNFQAVMDEAQAFLDGNRSADDVAKAVQSKVKLHVNEQR